MSEYELAARVVARLHELRQTVCTCESVTGGLICAALTAVPGSSAVVRGALVTYATDLKTTLAGVPDDTLSLWGVVSAETAAAMATGAAEVTGAQWAIAVTGVAGPEPVDQTEPGTVWLAISGPSRLWTQELGLAGTREAIRRDTVTASLTALLTRLG